ncbi:MAG TPA: DinB family protein, partial [Pyrinomonadaceae bacterium]|nr:DinB family protein [Pyrinomonadaceae bacterium]
APDARAVWSFTPRRRRIKKMTELTIGRPEETEYLAYYGRYVALVPEGDIVATLSRQVENTAALLRGVAQSQERFRYAPGKWSVRELVGHMIDTERIFAYRAMRFARNDQTPLPGYDENEYVANSSYDSYPFGELAAELRSVREATVFLFKHMGAEAWARAGSANGSEVSVRALAYIIAGHELHHRGILRDRYLTRRADD